MPTFERRADRLSKAHSRPHCLGEVADTRTVPQLYSDQRRCPDNAIQTVKDTIETASLKLARACSVNLKAPSRSHARLWRASEAVISRHTPQDATCVRSRSTMCCRTAADCCSQAAIQPRSSCAHPGSTANLPSRPKPETYVLVLKAVVPGTLIAAAPKSEAKTRCYWDWALSVF